MKKLLSSILDFFSYRIEGKIIDDPAWKEIIPEFEKTIGFKFKNINLLQAAFMHASYINRITGEHQDVSAFERMEFLGDSILGLVVAEELFVRYPDQPEGIMSKMKSKLVSEKYLALIAEQIDLGRYLLVSAEEDRSGGRKRKSILSDAMEALICAIYLDSGMAKARSFIHRLVLKDFEEALESDALMNFKSILQEYSQAKYQKPPDYMVVDEKGPDHKKTFTVSVSIQNEILGTGSGRSKKQAEQDAARIACNRLGL